LNTFNLDFKILKKQDTASRVSGLAGKLLTTSRVELVTQWRRTEKNDLESVLVLCDVDIKRKWIGLNDFIDVRLSSMHEMIYMI
jgi:hypothetical protein